MKNICIFTNTLQSGGAEKQAVLLSKVLSREYNVWLVVYYANLVEPFFLDVIESEKINIIYLNGNNHLIRIFKLFRFLRNESIDIIFSYLFTTNFIGGFIGRICRVPYIIGGIRNSVLSSHKLWMERALHKNILDYSVFNNYSGVNNLVNKGFKKYKCIVIPNCIEAKTQPIIRNNNNVITIITVARFVQQKDFFTSLVAIKKLISLLYKSKFSIAYKIIGYGYLENQISDWIKELNLNDYVDVIIKPQNLNEYYINADIYFCTSLFEGLSNSIMEAMSYSLPIMATDVGDNGKIVNDGFNGYLTNIKDANGMAQILNKLVINYQLRNKYGQNSYSLIMKKYSIEKFASRYIEFIEMLDG